MLEATTHHARGVLRLQPGAAKSLADVQAFVDEHPDTTDVDQPANATDSNPYGVAWVDATHYLVADAANNTCKTKCWNMPIVDPANSSPAIASGAA